MRRSSYGSFWPPLLEKAFAKLNGNYEVIGGGWQSESFRILNGAPSSFYMLSSLTYQNTWNIIVNALNSGYLVGVDSPSTSTYGIATGHAHTIVGAY